MSDTGHLIHCAAVLRARRDDISAAAESVTEWCRVHSTMQTWRHPELARIASALGCSDCKESLALAENAINQALAGLYNQIGRQTVEGDDEHE